MNFSENMIELKGKKVSIALPLPELNQTEIKFISEKKLSFPSNESSEKIKQSVLSLSYQNALKDNIIQSCQKNTEEIMNNTIRTHRDIKLDFL